MYRPSGKKKNGRCSEVIVRERWPLVEIRLYNYTTSIFWHFVDLKLQKTALSNTVILTEINAAIQLSIEGHCVCNLRSGVIFCFCFFASLLLWLERENRLQR